MNMRATWSLGLVLLAGLLAVAQEGGRGPEGPRGPGGPKGQGPDLPGPEGQLVRKYFQMQRTAKFAGVRFQEVMTPQGWVSGSENVLQDGPRRRVTFGRDSQHYGEVMVDDGKQRLHFFPDTNEIHIMPRLGEDFGGRMGPPPGGGPPGEKPHNKEGRFGQHGPRGVQAKATPGGQVAGRLTTLVSVLDNSGNPLQKMWFDIKTGVLLKREGFDLTNRRVAYMEFREINYRARLTNEDFQLRKAGAKIITPEILLSREAKRQGLPPYVLTHNDLQLEGVMGREFKNKRGLACVYGSPEGRLTLMIVQGNPRLDQLDRMAGRFGQAFSWTQGPCTFILMGPTEKSKLQAYSRTLSTVKP